METFHWLPGSLLSCIFFFFAVNCRKLQQPNGHPEVGQWTSSTSNQTHLISRLLHKRLEATFLTDWKRFANKCSFIYKCRWITIWFQVSAVCILVIFLYKSLVAEQLCDVAVKLPSYSNYVIICGGISALNRNLWGSGWTLNVSS